MLSQKYRLTKEKDFKKIRSFGRSFFTPCFRLRHMNTDAELSRFAIIVSTKTSKKATVRNRVKRQIREIIRLNRTKIRDGHDIVISVNSKALNKSYQEIEKEILSVFKKAKLLK